MDNAPSVHWVAPFGNLRIWFLFADPRSLSQLITSFFASESLGIPHTPLFTSFKRLAVLSLDNQRSLCMSLFYVLARVVKDVSSSRGRRDKSRPYTDFENTPPLTLLFFHRVFCEYTITLYYSFISMSMNVFVCLLPLWSVRNGYSLQGMGCKHRKQLTMEQLTVDKCLPVQRFPRLVVFVSSFNLFCKLIQFTVLISCRVPVASCRLLLLWPLSLSIFFCSPNRWQFLYLSTF